MNPSEAVIINGHQLSELRKLVSQGEGPHLEFKRKASHPEKIIREMIAFANTDGGTVLIGVEDNGAIPGVKYPEEEILVIHQALQNACRPSLVINETIIPLDENLFVVRLDIPVSLRRPHFNVLSADSKESYVRASDMSIKASREMVEIVRRSKQKKDIRFNYGDPEKQLMEYLELNKTITLDEYRKLAKLNRFRAAKKLVLLVLANVLRITPSEKGDLYSRI
jgi:predicted HTH transcriptional regulator